MSIYLFHNNKYTRWYHAIIYKAIAEQRKRLPIGSVDRVYYEAHHIIPKSMGGKEIVLLTAKEHFICHLLLTKMTNDYKMKHAAFRMMNGKNEEKYRITSSVYSYLKKCKAEATSVRHKGKVNSPETRRLMSENQSGMKRSKETREKQSKLKIKTWVITFPDGHEETISNLKEFCITNNLNIGNLHSTAQGRRLHHKGYSAAYL
jgi:hypothetical protein